MPRFKVDENLPSDAAELLAAAGHDALTVGDQRMVGQPDMNLGLICQREGRAIVSSTWTSPTFAPIRRATTPASSSLRPARLDRPRVLSILQRLLPVLEHEPLAGKLWIVEETSVRVRG